MSEINAKRVLSEKDIENYINNWCESEDDFESSDDECVPDADFDIEKLPIFFDNEVDNEIAFKSTEEIGNVQC